MKYSSNLRVLMLALLLSVALVNISFFLAISSCCKFVSIVLDWASKPAAYVVQLIPWKTDKQFWLLIFLIQYLEYTVVFWAVLSVVGRIRDKKKQIPQSLRRRE